MLRARQAVGTGPAHTRAAPTVLVVYYSNRARLRGTVLEHLYSFERHPGVRCVYLNLAVRRPWRLLARLDFDLVVFDYTFLSVRFNRQRFTGLMRRARPLRALRAVKVAIPQDEFINTDLLCTFIRDMGISHVFTAAGEHDWPVIYGELGPEVAFTTVLTGYLSDRTVDDIERLRPMVERTLDIGYRARDLPPWLGRHAQLKAGIAAAVAQRASQRGLRVDISTREQETLIGDDWLRLLLRSRATIGVEGGAGLLDRDGAVRARTEEYVRTHPGARFDEVEAACFPGLDGALQLFAISPRHLEACATRTLQILVEGHYNGVLQAGRHYVPVRADLSNLDEALDSLRDDSLRERVCATAYEDVVLSRRYHYDAFVELVLARSLGRREPAPAAGGRVRHAGLAALRAADHLSWRWVAARFALYSAVTGAARRLQPRRGLA